ncbi:MAG: NTPase [Sulfolobales archaeon]
MSKILITGSPGVGKTTLFTKILSSIAGDRYRVAGFVCPEVREGGRRAGFRIVDLSSGVSGWLAISFERLGGLCRGTRIGRYCVIEDDVSRVMENTERSLEGADLIAIDEIGPMELSVESCRRIIYKSIEMKKPGLFVVHLRLVDEISERIGRAGMDYTVYRVELNNRDSLYHEILPRIRSMLGQGRAT